MRLFIFLFLIIGQTTIFAQYKTYTKKSDSDPKAKVVLDKLKKTLDGYASVEMNFTLTLELPKQSPEVQKGVLIQSGKKFQLKMDQQEFYSDGKTSWVYFKKNKQVQVMDYEETASGSFMSPKQLLQMYEKGNFVYMIIEERKEKGNTILDIEFKPLDLKEEYSKMRFTVNKTLNKVVSLKVFSKDGSRYSLQLNSITPNKKYDPSVFVFNAKSYPGVRVEDLRID